MTDQPKRYIMANRQLPGNGSHGQARWEYIVYDERGTEIDRLEITPSTAGWLHTGHGLEPISPAAWYALASEHGTL